jgi:signal transduction histidine kinase
MNQTSGTFETYAAERLQATAPELAAAWLGRVSQQRDGDGAGEGRVGLQAAAELLSRAGDFVCTDDAEALRRDPQVSRAAAALVRERTREIGSHAQLLAELDVLAQLLDAACLEWLGSYPGEAPQDAVVRVTGRLNRAPILLGEIGMGATDGMQGAGDAATLNEVRRFADLLSHELNTPLNAAVVTAQLLEFTDDVVTSPEARRLVSLIRRNLARADAIMRDVRSVALSNGQRTPQPARSFGQVLGSVLAEVHDELVREGVRLEVEEPVADVKVDAARVKLILVNLVRNAIRYSDPTRSDRRVRVSCSRNATADQWWVHVSDNGLGIPEEFQDSIFRRHFRAHPERGTGTGLGLMIVRAEVAALGSRIEFTSEAGTGTTFSFLLPPLPGPEPREP